MYFSRTKGAQKQDHQKIKCTEAFIVLTQTAKTWVELNYDQ